MTKVSENDWKEFNALKATSPMLEWVIDGQSTGLHFVFIAELYKRYRLGDWNNEVPLPESLEDKTQLMWKDEAYCIFHQNHEKFGVNIIECAHPGAKNVFVFFDYFMLEEVFNVLNRSEVEQTPYIPTYYAHPYDRYDYKNGSHCWPE